MKDLQSVFDQIQEIKKEMKGIRREYKDQLASEVEYEKVLEEIKSLKVKKEQLETEAKNALGSRWDKLEEHKREVLKLEEMASDIAMSTLMEGKTVAVKDRYDNDYEPVYKVSFRKMK